MYETSSEIRMRVVYDWGIPQYYRRHSPHGANAHIDARREGIFFRGYRL